MVLEVIKNIKSKPVKALASPGKYQANFRLL
jgi:hypothetical protein